MTNSADSEKTVSKDYRFTYLGRGNQLPVAVKRILVTTDLTSQSERAIEFGLALAKRFRAHLTLLHVYHESYAIQYLRGSHTLEEMGKERMHFLNALEFVGRKAKERYSDCDSEFRDGETCEEIVRAARERDTDLIIISTHHYHWLERFAYGSDADKILRSAPCPILVMQADEG